MPRGGKRPGAGRKTKDPGQKRVTVTVRVAQETRRKLDKLKECGHEIGRLIDEVVAGI